MALTTHDDVWAEYEKSDKSKMTMVKYDYFNPKLGKFTMPSKLMPIQQLEDAMTYNKYNHFHEVVPHTVEVRGYHDVDVKNPPSPDECKQLVDSILKDTDDRFASVFPHLTPEQRKPIIMNGSRLPEKFSLHIVYPDAWFENTGHLLDFMEPLYAKYTKKVLDPFFSRTDMKQIRMPFCSKLEYPDNPMIPEGHLPIFSKKMFKRCLMTTTVYHPGVFPTMLSYERTDKPVRSISVKRPKGSNQTMEGIEAVLDYLKEMNGNFKSEIRFDTDKPGSWQAYIIPGLYCLTLANRDGKGYHGTNNMVIGSDDGKHVYQICQDPNCLKRVYFTEDFQFLLSPHT